MAENARRTTSRASIEARTGGEGSSAVRAVHKRTRLAAPSQPRPLAVDACHAYCQ